MSLPLAARESGGPTVADLAMRYLEEHVAVRVKPATQKSVLGVLRNLGSVGAWTGQRMHRHARLRWRALVRECWSLQG